MQNPDPTTLEPLWRNNTTTSGTGFRTGDLVMCLAHVAVQMRWIGRFRARSPYMGVSLESDDRLVEKYLNETFIEAGGGRSQNIREIQKRRATCHSIQNMHLEAFSSTWRDWNHAICAYKPRNQYKRYKHSLHYIGYPEA
ncbi:predicted protein [Histoplasma capsulatum G186AR]|uniref:Uncharacterized protein n=1 Tax=Ajellomyces capsulatus (strain G186AR / H82 / ATCC MYA-2454 / RMSCC 2432) TaxID=447093 RepID=C0NI82_AJECG|nr:uncharacterized protein HCBG_03054 [Histoplasma capsulatum G186AR]EEH09517.1 predicted protein [Histoplasma capsulatum G186AR]